MIRACKSPRTGPGGFTITELLVVLFLVGIALIASASLWTRWRDSYKFQGLVKELLTTISLARARAIAVQNPLELKFMKDSVTKDYYVNDKGSSLEFHYLNAKTEDNKPYFTISILPLSSIRFNARGFAVGSDGVTKTTYLVDVSSAARLAPPAVRITVNPLGRVTYEAKAP